MFNIGYVANITQIGRSAELGDCGMGLGVGVEGWKALAILGQEE